jgi:hypothetical protein
VPLPALCAQVLGVAEEHIAAEGRQVVGRKILDAAADIGNGFDIVGRNHQTFEVDPSANRVVVEEDSAGLVESLDCVAVGNDSAFPAADNKGASMDQLTVLSRTSGKYSGVVGYNDETKTQVT